MKKYSGNMTKKLGSALIVSMLILSNTALSFADVRDTKLEHLRQLSTEFRTNIDNTDLLDTNAGSKWQMKVDSELVKDGKEAKKFLQGVYSVVPFFNSMTIKSLSGNYTMNLENLSAYDSNTVVDVAKKWISEIIKDDMTQVQKLRAIHDKIINETVYDASSGDESHSPAGVALDKRAVCDGYTRMFTIMATLVEIPVVQVTSNTMNHAFNLVYIKGQWLLVDATYDDPVTSNGKQVLKHDYFLIGPADSKKHKFDSSENGLTLSDYIKIGNYIYQDVI